MDAGFGYALVPSLYTMPDPFHKILRWKGSPTAPYGLYHRSGARDGLVAQFVDVATETYGSPGYVRPLPESWRP